MKKQCALVAKDSNILGCTSSSEASRSTEPIVPFPLVLVRLNLEDSAQFGALQYKKNVDGLEQVNGQSVDGGAGPEKM